MNKENIDLYDIFNNLYLFWNKFNCKLLNQYNNELLLPLFHPDIFFNLVSNEEKNNFILLQEVKNFTDFNNQNQINNSLKLQIIITSNLEFSQKIILESLKFLELNFENNDIRFNNIQYNNSIFKLSSIGTSLFFNNQKIVDCLYIKKIASLNEDQKICSIIYDFNNILKLFKNDNLDFYEKNYKNFILNTTSNNFIFSNFENDKNIAITLINEKLYKSGYEYILKAIYSLNLLIFRNFITHNNKTKYEKEIRDLLSLCYENINNIK